MKRLQEKVKDIVEVRVFSQLQDVAADPAATLASYRFTDITSDLMGKWLERVAHASRANGAAVALAGFRGVGKSHFLAAVGAILTRPELRSQISDEHVKNVADALARKQYPVARVRRGSREGLVDELRAGVAEAIGVNPGTLGPTVGEILHEAGMRAGEQPFVIFFDTAMGRETRVQRDDGALLSEAAELAKSMGMLVGVALDDDIAGADGANSSIAATFQIDYLDQEHLFKIVDTHIFAKESAKVPLLREVYREWRDVLPGFRWSEQRFLSLYPMHPATLEVAPLIRLYIQDFAMLGFAVEAGVKILGRPANSLIGLDEMFDGVENKLRRVAELKDAFAAFDSIEKDVIAKAPVASRLVSKLILKGLFLLSLDGQGASADDLAATMMIYGPGTNVGAALESFASAGGAVLQDGKYCLKSGGAALTADALTALDAAAAEVSDDDVWTVLLRQTSEKFSDVEASDDFGQVPTPCTVEWRGSLRRGELVWRHESFQRDSTADWTIFVDRRSDSRLNTQKAVLLWRVAMLTDQERSTLRRYHILRSDATIRAEMGDGLATQIQIHSIAAERIWQRVFMHEARLAANGEEFEIVDESASAHTLSQLLSRALTPYFEARYPQHPLFAGTLGVKEVSTLVADFFGGSAPGSSEVRQLVDAFAAPLALGVSADSSAIATSGEELMQLAVVRRALGSQDPKEVSFAEVAGRLGAAPLGLTREAQHLVLAALVSHGQYDFVTTSGNRINHRSLDLQIVWDDIQGIAIPREEDYPVERLLSWAALLTGNGSLRSIDRGEDRRLIVESLDHWLERWRADNTLAKFDDLPDEQLNTAVWKLAAGLKRTFGVAAEAIGSLLKDKIALVECLKTVADRFNDSEAEYDLKTDELAILNQYVLLSAERGLMLSYIASADWTGDEEVDALRRELLQLVISGGVGLNGKNDRVAEMWNEYRAKYADHFAGKHSAVMDAVSDTQNLRDLMSSELWSVCQGISGSPLFDKQYIWETEQALRRFRTGMCAADPAIELKDRPVCACGLGLGDLDEFAELPAALRRALERGISDFRGNVLRQKEDLLATASKISPGSNMEFLINTLETSQGFPRLDARDLLLLKHVCDESARIAIDDAVEVELLSI